MAAQWELKRKSFSFHDGSPTYSSDDDSGSQSRSRSLGSADTSFDTDTDDGEEHSADTDDGEEQSTQPIGTAPLVAKTAAKEAEGPH